MRQFSLHPFPRINRATCGAGLIALIMATGLHGADGPSAVPSRTPVKVKPDETSGGNLSGLQLAPQKLFRNVSPGDISLRLDRPTVPNYQTPAERDALDRRRNWIFLEPQDAFKSSGSSGLFDPGKSLSREKADEQKWRSRFDRYREGAPDRAPDGNPIDRTGRTREQGGGNGDRSDPDYQRAVFGEGDRSRPTRKATSSDSTMPEPRGLFGVENRNPFGLSIVPTKSPGLLDAREREQREVRMNEFNQLFSSSSASTVSNPAGANSTGVENRGTLGGPLGGPLVDPSAHPAPDTTTARPLIKTSGPDLGSIPSPGQAGKISLQGLSDSRVPAVGAADSTPRKDPDAVRPKAPPPIRLDFPKRVF